MKFASDIFKSYVASSPVFENVRSMWNIFYCEDQSLFFFGSDIFKEMELDA